MSNKNDLLAVNARAIGSMMLPGFCKRCWWREHARKQEWPYQRPMPGVFQHIHRVAGDTMQLGGPFSAGICAHLGKPGWEASAKHANPKTTHWTNYCMGVATERGKLVVRGTPDVLMINGKEALLIDFKTSDKNPASDGWFKAYQGQVSVYREIGLALGLYEACTIGLVYLNPQTVARAREVGKVVRAGGGLFESTGCAFQALAPVTVEVAPVELGMYYEQAMELLTSSEAPADGNAVCMKCYNYLTLYREMGLEYRAAVGPA